MLRSIHRSKSSNESRSRKLGLAVKVQHHADLASDDRANQRAFVSEIVGKLRAADRRGFAHVLHVRRRQALGDDQLGGGLHDPVAGGTPLGGQPLFVLNIGMGHRVRLTRGRLDLWDLRPIQWLCRPRASGGHANLGEEVADQLGDFVQRGLQQEVPTVEQMDLGVG